MEDSKDYNTTRLQSSRANSALSRRRNIETSKIERKLRKSKIDTH